MATQSIPVAAVDAPRRRDDEVLPEHEERWPTTRRVEQLIRDRYDGSISTAHEIGLELVTVKHGCYPGWRIKQIAVAMGVADEKSGEIIERVRAAEANEKIERGRTQGATPTAQDVKPRTLYSTPTCEQCGQVFEPWRRYKGRPTPTKLCHDCWVAKFKRPTPEAAPDGTESAQPVAEPASVEAATPHVDWLDVLPKPRSTTPADPETEAVSYAHLVEDPPELTFGDLPGSGIVFELLDLLPTDGRWKPLRRLRWLHALEAALDLLIEEEFSVSEEAGA